MKILHEHLQTASLKGDELGSSTSPTKEKESLQNSSGMQKNLTTLPNIFSTLLVITNLYGVYIPSIIFITRDQRGIMAGGCKLFTQRPCLSKQREQLFYFNHLERGRNTTWDMFRDNLLSYTRNSGGATYILSEASLIHSNQNKDMPQQIVIFAFSSHPAFLSFLLSFFFKSTSIITSLLPHWECAGSWKCSDDGEL